MRQGPFSFLYLVADEYPPFRPDVEVLFGKELLGRGYRIEWIMRAADPDQPIGPLEWRGCKVWVAPTNSGTSRFDRIRKHLSGLRNDMRAFSLVKMGVYDFVQVKDKFLAAIMAILAARRQKIKCFFWLSFPFPEQSLELARSPSARYPFYYFVRGHVFNFILYRIVCRKADHIFVQSEEMKRAMTSKGVPADRMTAVPMGVDMDTLIATHAADPAGQEGSSPAVVYLGALDRARHLEFLLEVFALVVNTHRTATLYLVGDSEEPGAREFLQAEARRLGIERQVVFTGFLPREEALAYVRAAAVCVALTRADSVYGVASSTKLIEYMALNRPVLANSHPDQQRVVEESGSGLCVPWDLNTFADGLAWLLEHPEEARAMGKRGRSYIERTRAYRRIADNLELEYRRLMSQTS